MMEHIFREFRDRGIDPFGYGDTDAEDVSSDEEDLYTSSSSDPMEVTVKMTADPGFEPDEIQAEVDRPVRLIIENVDVDPHDFTIDEISFVSDPGRY